MIAIAAAAVAAPIFPPAPPAPLGYDAPRMKIGVTGWQNSFRGAVVTTGKKEQSLMD